MNRHQRYREWHRLPETVTHRTRNGAQTYKLVAVKPHVRADGGETRFAIWRSRCRQCGETFDTTSGTSKRAIARIGTVHCPQHRKKRRHIAPSARTVEY
jgi:hypothetical protein